MKKLLIALLALGSFSVWSSDCSEAHMNSALKKSNQALFKNVTFIESEDWSNVGWKVVGGIWLISGAVNTSLGAFPVIVAGIGASLLTKSIIASVQEPRYQLLQKMLVYRGTKSEEEIYTDKTFKRLMKKAKRRLNEAHPKEVLRAFADGIKSGDFCRNSGKPYSFKRMEREILENL